MLEATEAEREGPAGQAFVVHSVEGVVEARGPVGIPEDGVAGEGSVGETMGTVRAGAAPQLPVDSRRSVGVLLKEPRPPLGAKAPRAGALYPRGPDGGTIGAFSGRLWADIDAGALGGADTGAGDARLRLALGPVGALRLAAGPRGGERGYGEGSCREGARCGERSSGVDLAASR